MLHWKVRRGGAEMLDPNEDGVNQNRILMMNPRALHFCELDLTTEMNAILASRWGVNCPILAARKAKKTSDSEADECDHAAVFVEQSTCPPFNHKWQMN